MIQAPDFCPILPQNSQINFYQTRGVPKTRLESCCIIFGGRWSAKIIRALTWSVQGSWGFSHLYITIESMNTYFCVYSQFYVSVKEYDEIYHLRWNECLKFIDLWQCLHALEEKSYRVWRVPAQDMLFAFILCYVEKTLYWS